MKPFIYILLFFTILMQPLQSLWVRLAFELNRDYIAKNLCENRFKPELKCGGKCYLMKKLAEKQKQEKEAQKERTEVFSFTLFAENLPNFTFQQSFNEIKSLFPTFFLLSPYQEHLFDTFHPPRV